VYKLTSFSVGLYDNNVYLLSDPKTKEALLIDAANDAPRIIKELDGLRVSHILTTHGHADHESMMPIPADHRVSDGERFRFGEYEVVAVHTPGHTPGSICFIAEDRLFSGDTLFPGGPGNTANPYASFPTIIESIRARLFVLPNETQVLPGHGKPTTIGRERPHLDEWIQRGW
jgi:glyoxylase-like metal-dependent hydrolase (beta-lactamase superfamily II)